MLSTNNFMHLIIFYDVEQNINEMKEEKKNINQKPVSIPTTVRKTYDRKNSETFYYIQSTHILYILCDGKYYHFLQRKH